MVQVGCTSNYGRTALWKETKTRFHLPKDGDNLRQPQNEPTNGFLMMAVNPETGRSAET
jgi:hypothetical protein